MLNIQHEELYDQCAAEGEMISRFVHALIIKRCVCVCVNMLFYFLSICAAHRHYRTSDNSRSSITDRACGVNSRARVCVSV